MFSTIPKGIKLKIIGMFICSLPCIYLCVLSTAPVLPGAYHTSPTQGYGYMQPASMSSMRSMHSPHAHSPSQSLRTYRAMYDYSAQDEDEVSFRDGDYIVNVQPIDEGWMYGTVQRTGKTGMLPANYIEPVN
ncbi:hypothetical protein AB205_0142770 [Aquarana catesbeiana]|uniref:SH3 domain-containing protein n=1 Tax=Aquarana catesbeiana TaxID=8400 RepID=A0A2G9P3Y5_AQUCT|nr:hypothetical protein AB205_0142770 [Aquarana catesbeiana]PIN98062.1 hypothetical protein AB205_0142770 [Aquarana catesbeiana]